MYWEITEMSRAAPQDAPEGAERFVLHRHVDGSGAHIDLRLESGNCLLGWRIASESLEPGCWATEKMPHPTRWLEEDGDMCRADAGVYAWHEQDADTRALALHGRDGTTTLRFTRVAAPPVESIRALTGLARAHRHPLDRLESLAADGVEARRNAIARFCGLSRELDGAGFDETAWRRLLADMSLREINERLAKVETRYDRIHPPEPISRAEPLPDIGERTGAAQARQARAREILGQDGASFQMPDA